MPKCASTTLQTHVFPYIDGTLYLGLVNGEQASGAMSIEMGGSELQWLVDSQLRQAVHAMIYEQTFPSWAIDYLSLLRQRAEDSGSPVVFSHESFFHYWSNVPVKERVRRLSVCFPDASVLVISRPADRILRSIWRDARLAKATDLKATFEQWKLTLDPDEHAFELWVKGEWREEIPSQWESVNHVHLDRGERLDPGSRHLQTLRDWLGTEYGAELLSLVAGARDENTSIAMHSAWLHLEKMTASFFPSWVRTRYRNLRYRFVNR